MKRILLGACLCVALLSLQGQAVTGIREVPDLLYVSADAVADDQLQRLNLVLPEGQTGYPLLVWIGGGAWSYVDRHVEMGLARRLAQAGIGVASVGHRLSRAIWRDSSLSTGIQHPAHIEDVAAAVRWLCDQAATYGYDTTNLFVGGFSSGAHLAALLSLDTRYLRQVGLSPTVVRGVIPISGTYDIADYYEVLHNSNRPELADLHVKAVFGDSVEGFAQASPVSYLDALSPPPMLVMADGNLSGYTDLLQSRMLETAFRDFQVLHIHDLSHVQLWRHLSGERSIYRDMIVAFIWDHAVY
ncbi:MAG: hypothetical protein OHK0039_17360 [Bacteroidia bacterium]